MLSCVLAEYGSETFASASARAGFNSKTPDEILDDVRRMVREMPDPHATEAARMFGVPLDQVTIKMRHHAKVQRYVRDYSNPHPIRLWKKLEENNDE